MSTAAARPGLVFCLLALLLVLYGGWAVAPQSALYRELLTPRVLIVIASLAKLGFLLAGALLAFACRDGLEEGNPARPAWALLSVGMFATLAGQMSLAPFQIVRGTTPFPSVGDLYYVLSYPFLIAAFLVFLRASGEAGFPIGPLPERLAIIGAVALVGGAVVVRMLPLAAAGGELLERILTVAYPLLDIVLLMPLALLMRMTLRMRGSRVGAVWGLLLAGAVFLAMGDISFGYFTVFDVVQLDPYTHMTYILSYGLIAAGAQRQLLLLKS